MNLLRDEDIYKLVTGQAPIVSPVTQPRLVDQKAGQPPDPSAAWFGKDSPIQAASLDLHVGAILIPETAKDRPGSPEDPKTKHVLRLGYTAVVTTKEELDLPSDIAAFGFPPSRVSFQGLLMTNPGHVDPGYKGKMRFTVINVGKEDIPLNAGDPIVSLLFVKLDEPVKKSYRERRNNAPVLDPKREDVDRLSLDFLAVESRAKKAANTAILKAQIVAGIVALVVPIVVATIAFWKPFENLRTEVQSNGQKVAEITELLDLDEKKSRLDVIEQLQKQIELLMDQVEQPGNESATGQSDENGAS